MVWSIALFVWSTFMVLPGFVEVFWMFLLLRVCMGMGMGEGVNSPAMNRALVDWIHPSELERATSLAVLGVVFPIIYRQPLRETRP